MARMLPNRIPAEIADDPLRGAERRAYQRLEATLDDSYTVFGWVPWLKQEQDRLAEGEADFFIAHEVEGLLVVEIKGGLIGRDPGSGRWTSTDREGRQHEIADPGHQVRRNLHAVLNRLRQLPGWEQRRIRAGVAVVMPDCQRAERDLSMSMPLAVLAFQEDMANLGPCLRRILRTHPVGDPSAPGLGVDGLEALENLVAGSFALRAPLGPVLRDEDREILQLTEEQYRVLDGLAANPRVLVSGAAGTGKTMLAMEQARRLARLGRRTLLTCFNRPLADYLRQSTGAGGRVAIANFHQLCFQWARRAGLEAADPDGPEADSLPDSYFQQDLPRLFLDALDRVPDRFDSIVVDEGQDFRPDYWDALQLSFEDLTRGTLHVFRDKAQDIFAAGADSLRDIAKFELSENLRNTRQIHRVLRGLSADDHTVAKGPAGVAPEWIAATPDEEPARLAGTIERLIREEGFTPPEIAVLTTSRREVATLAPDGALGGYAITRDPLERSARVLVESIPRFKGLERRVIVLAGLRESRHGTLEKLLYVGASRARVHLVVIAEEGIIARLRAGP